MHALRERSRVWKWRVFSSALKKSHDDSKSRRLQSIHVLLLDVLRGSFCRLCDLTMTMTESRLCRSGRELRDSSYIFTHISRL